MWRRSERKERQARNSERRKRISKDGWCHCMQRLGLWFKFAYHIYACTRAHLHHHWLTELFLLSIILSWYGRTGGNDDDTLATTTETHLIGRKNTVITQELKKKKKKKKETNQPIQSHSLMNWCCGCACAHAQWFIDDDSVQRKVCEWHMIFSILVIHTSHNQMECIVCQSKRSQSFVFLAHAITEEKWKMNQTAHQKRRKKNNNNWHSKFALLRLAAKFVFINSNTTANHGEQHQRRTHWKTGMNWWWSSPIISGTKNSNVLGKHLAGACARSLIYQSRWLIEPRIICANITRWLNHIKRYATHTKGANGKP